MKNSLLLSAGTIFVSMLCAVPAAYAASRWRFRGRRMLLETLLVLNAFPQVLSLFALFRVLKTTGLLNQHIGLILIYAGSMCVQIMLKSAGAMPWVLGPEDRKGARYHQ